MSARLDSEKEDKFGNLLHRTLIRSSTSDQRVWVPVLLSAKPKRGPNAKSLEVYQGTWQCYALQMSGGG